MSSPSRRAGVALIEALVAAAILAVSVTALVTLSSQQPRAVALDEGRQLATMLLQELQSAFGKQTYAGLMGFGFPGPPADGGAETFDQGFYTLLEDHPLITLPGAAAEAPAGQRTLAANLEAADIWRAIYVEDADGPGGKRQALMTFRVYYEVRGRRRHVDAFEVVTER